MEELIQILTETTKEAMQKAIDHLKSELLKIRAGKANPNMLDGIYVDYYGTQTPLNQVSNVNTLDARTINIQPWEKNMLEPIERAIINSNLGLTPQNNGELILINIPPLTEERRAELVKQAKSESENAKVSVRNARKEANVEVKNLQKDGLSEDNAHDVEVDIQKMTDDFVHKIDELCKSKEQDIMTI